MALHHALRALAHVTSEVLHALPLDIQQKSNLSVALQMVHDIAADIEQGTEYNADAPAVDLGAIVNAAIEGISPSLVALVESVVARELAKITPPPSA